MGGSSATQRFERGVVLASLKPGETKIQVHVGKGPIDSTDGFEFFGGVREALLTKCSQGTIIVLAGGLRRRANGGDRDQEKCC